MTSVYRNTYAKQDKDGRRGRDGIGISINQFVSIAVAEKLAIMQAESYFAERIARADLEAFDQLMSRSGGQAPRVEDEG
jgi:alkanesulfonate monooxygenase SsuD/methylene tetrahydromethanopterin reductase-like flavin-dependent oxidoreductase (luciferase family)